MIKNLINKRIVVRGFLYGIISMMCMYGQVDYLYAQSQKEYQILRDHYYNREFDKLLEYATKLKQKHPNSFTLFDYMFRTMIVKGDYESAHILIDNQQKNRRNIEYDVRRVELFLVQQDTIRAYNVIDNAIQLYKHSLNSYLRSIQILRSNEKGDKAYYYLTRAIERFPKNINLKIELARNYFLKANFKKAGETLVDILYNHINHFAQVRSFLHSNKANQMMEVVASNMDRILSKKDIKPNSYTQLVNLYLWMLQKLHYYDEAVIVAMREENKSKKANYYVFNLGQQLVKDKIFAEAINCYTYYYQQPKHKMYMQGVEKLANTYYSWGKYSQRYDTLFNDEANRFYKKAYEITDTLLIVTKNKKKKVNLLKKLIIWSMDHFDDIENAQKYYAILDKQETNKSFDNWLLKGRISLYQGHYTDARYAFAQAARKTKTKTKKQNSNFYLALTDFFAGEYEFARFYLERNQQDMSNFKTNDMIQYHWWMVKSYAWGDTEYNTLKKFSEFAKDIYVRDITSAIKQYESFSKSEAYSPLRYDALSMLVEHTDTLSIPNIYVYINDYINEYAFDVGEKLYWYRVKLADYWFHFNTMADVDMPKLEDIRKMYEDILIQFPKGFYTSLARKRLLVLKNTETS